MRYLIARHEHNRLELLTLAETPRGEALPVFGTERAARDFLQRGGWGGGWWVRESTTGELVSLLSGHLAETQSVALDPRPGSVAYGDVELWDAREFIELLMSEPFVSPPH